MKFVSVPVTQVQEQFITFYLVVTNVINAGETLNMNASRNTAKLAQGKQNRLVDIDGTICDDISNEDSHLYPSAKDFEGAVQRINEWYDAGDWVIFFTAREEKDRKVTEDWLRLHGFKYHYLLMGKPRGGNYYWLDNLKGRFEHFTGSWKDVKG